MLSIQWTPGLKLRLAPGDVEDFTIALAEWLDGDDLDTFDATASGATIAVTGVGPDFATVRLSDSTGCGSLVFTAAATNGRTLQRTILLETYP